MCPTSYIRVLFETSTVYKWMLTSIFTPSNLSFMIDRSWQVKIFEERRREKCTCPKLIRKFMTSIKLLILSFVSYSFNYMLLLQVKSPSKRTLLEFSWRRKPHTRPLYQIIIFYTLRKMQMRITSLRQLVSQQ